MIVATQMPTVVDLADWTTDLLQQGVGDSGLMRRCIAERIGLTCDDERWARFVNSHSWALVRLQSAGVVRKVAPGRYELARGPVVDLAGDRPTPPIVPGERLPSWARQMVRSANARNRQRWGGVILTEADLRELWASCGGRCVKTALPFLETQHGTGRARRPYAPSLDRKDVGCGYVLANCRLVLQSVNFALNAYGDEVFDRMVTAAAARCKS